MKNCLTKNIKMEEVMDDELQQAWHLKEKLTLPQPGQGQSPSRISLGGGGSAAPAVRRRRSRRRRLLHTVFTYLYIYLFDCYCMPVATPLDLLHPMQMTVLQEQLAAVRISWLFTN